MKKIRAFILAAGLGERLRPITNHLPKPLLPVLGRPAIEVVMEKISALAPMQIGVNIHHKPEMLKEWAQKTDFSKSLTLFCEEKILGTGGALKNAGAFLRGGHFIVHNSDILSDISLRTLVDKHLMEGNIATLAVHNYHQFNNVWLDDHGRFRAVGEGGPARRKGFRQVAFTGIAVYSPEFLELLPEGNSSVTKTWLKAVSSGKKVGTVDFTGCRWSDIGTPEAFSSYVFSALAEKGEAIHIDPSIDCSEIDLGANTVIEKGCLIEKGASLRNCILLPGATARAGSLTKNAVVGPDYCIALKEPLSMPSSLPSHLISGFLSDSPGETKMFRIGSGGSDRRYYRIREGDKTAVIMECQKTDRDYQRHIIYTQFLRKYSMPVPELLGSDAGNAGPIPVKRGYVYGVFEDLGDISLYCRLKCLKGDRIETLYRRVIDILINLHTVVTRNVSECLLLRSRTFDHDHLRWETDYFVERFLSGLKGIDINAKGRSLLNAEFDRLAAMVDSFRKTIVHRDFQSQNIMVTRGDIPRIIDYQGARMGPPAYDLASILWDPYVRLDAGLRDALLEYYIEKVGDYYGGAFEADEFRKTVLPCRMQRHMQALGAYGFLSKEKGLSHFLKYVPEALRYLKDEVAEVKKDYPVLFEYVSKIDEKT